MTDYYGLFVQICHLASLLHSHLGLTRACMDTNTPSVESSLEFKVDIELIQYLNSRNSEINAAVIILGQGLGGSSYLYAAEHFSHFIVALILVGISVYNSPLWSAPATIRHLWEIPLSSPVFAVCFCISWTDDTDKPTWVRPKIFF